MQIKEKKINKILIIFLATHIAVWTVIPSISNINLPLDTIEALAWGTNLDWGYSKHPPLSAWSVELFYKIFGNQDWDTKKYSISTSEDRSGVIKVWKDNSAYCGTDAAAAPVSCGRWDPVSAVKENDWNISKILERNFFPDITHNNFAI